LRIGKLLKSERLSENKFRITRTNSNIDKEGELDKNVHFNPCKRWKITMIKNCSHLRCGVTEINCLSNSYSNFQIGVHIEYNGEINAYGVMSKYSDSFGDDLDTLVLTYKYGYLSCDINGESYEKFPTKKQKLNPSFDAISKDACFEMEALE
jgi:hypothetical protein